MLKCLGLVGPCGSQVDHIDRRHSKLEQVPDDVLRSYRTLEECRLDANQIKELPKNFFRLERIRYLSLSDNDLSEIPPGLGKFSSLVELDISRNDISAIPNSIRFCSALQVLELSNNPLQSLPVGLCQLSKLRILCLNDVALSNLPAEFGSLQSLTKCELRDNRLSSLPDSFAKLHLLEFLDLGANEFKDVPPLLGELCGLMELWMDDNELQSVPPELGKLERLQQLDLSENMLTSLPEEIAGMASLSDMNLSQNNLNGLPASIGELKKLTVLKLNQNQLLFLTPSIGGCSALQELYLTENFLSALPPTIGNLESMFLLNADQNHICELPTEIGHCTALNILSLRENALRRLPHEIGNCSRLRVLDVSGNRLDRLPLSLANCPLTALWLSPNQSQPVVTLQRDVDDLTHEQFLTCYLLPQDQLSSQGEVDATVSPSELGSVTGPQSIPLNFINGPDNIPTEPNLAYESIHAAGEITTASANTRLSDTHRPSSVTSSTASSQRTPSAPLSPTAFYGAGRVKSPTGGHSQRASVQSGDLDSFGTTTTSSRVHFSSTTRSEEQQGNRTTSKGFPKTRHPKSTKKSGDHREDRHSIELCPTDTSRSSTASSPSRLLQKFECPTPLGEARLATAESWRTSNGSTPRALVNGQHSSLGTHAKEARDSTEDDNDSMVDHVNDHCGDERSMSPPHAKPRNKALDVPSSEASNSRPRSPPQTKVPMASSVGDVPFVDQEAAANPGVDEDEDAYSSGGEEICVITRRVGFSEDVEDNEEKSNQKLIRRDTPHYTKRARIQSKTADGVDSEEAVLKILEKYRSAVSTYPQDPNLSQGESNKTVELVSPNGFGNDSSSNTTEQQTLVFHIYRQPGSGLGLSIAGGVGSIPFCGSDPGIFVSRLNPNGLAYASGLRLRDKLIEVNGTNLVGVQHHVAVSALRANTDEFRIVVSRSVADSLPSQTSPVQAMTHSTADSLIRCTLTRDANGLGFSIVGGRGSAPSLFDPKAITISRIIEGGAASKSGVLKVGDQLVKVNNVDVQDADHDRVIALLTSGGPKVDIEARRRAVSSPANGFLSLCSPTSEQTVATLLHSPASTHLTTTSSSTTKSISATTSSRSTDSVPLRMEHGHPVERVVLNLNDGPLGLAIYGGSDINCLPFGDQEPGVFISKISPKGAAQTAGLRVGDRMLRVNDVDVRHATHDEAVRTLIEAKKDPLILEVRRDPPPPGLRQITIHRLANQRFGLRISGGIPPLTPPNHSNPLWLNDGSIFVSWIAPDGAVGLDGRVRLGDRLLEVNGHWIMGCSLDVALEVFRDAGSELTLLVCDGLSDMINNGKLVFGARSGTPSSPVIPSRNHGLTDSNVDDEGVGGGSVSASMISSTTNNSNHPGFIRPRPVLSHQAVRDF